MTRLLRGALLAALALCLVAAGCGGDTKSNNDYVGKINKAQTDFADSITKLQSNTGTTAADGQKVFTDLSTAIDKVVADLKAVEPPDKVKDLHNQLVAEIQQVGTAVKGAGEALASKDPQKIAAAQAKFATDVGGVGPKVTKTISDINAKLQE
jgi:hypothetical protein